MNNVISVELKCHLNRYKGQLLKTKWRDSLLKQKQETIGEMEKMVYSI